MNQKLRNLTLGTCDAFTKSSARLKEPETLISEFSTYRGLPSADPTNLPNAHKMADSVLCLPMHHLLSEEDINRILELVVK